MNNVFGPEARKVPAHMPHFIDSEIMEDLQNRWPKEFEKTSSHQLRAPDDMQFAFSYFYFMMHQRIPYDYDKVFDELDGNNDG